MILLCKLAALAFTTAVLSLMLRKDQPAFALVISVCAAAGILLTAAQQLHPLLDKLQVFSGYFREQNLTTLLQVAGIALAAQFAADICREAGLTAAATAAELCGRLLALLQALPLLESLLDSFTAYLQ